MRCDIRILSEGFDPEAEVAAFRASLDASGAMVSFTGMVRPSGTDGAVSALCLQHYPGMTERGIAEAVQGLQPLAARGGAGDPPGRRDGTA